MDDHSPFPATLRSSGDLAADRRYAWAMAALKDGAAAEAIDLFEQAAERGANLTPASARAPRGRR